MRCFRWASRKTRATCSKRVLRREENREGVPASLKHLSVTSLEVPPDRHLEIQAAFQRPVDNSVSKAVNLPHDATREVIAHIYQWAWELGLKGSPSIASGASRDR